MTAADARLDVDWTSELEAAWQVWLAPAEHKVHFAYEVEDGDLRRHMQRCYATAASAMQRVADLAAIEEPLRVLDHGCSAGFNALALRHLYPESTVFGFDPDTPAVELAAKLTAHVRFRGGGPPPAYEVGVGEALPYPDDHFDIVSSVTVLENVGDVEACVQEMHRFLRRGGVLYLETPNYQWPLEPHLHVVMPPRCPKPLLRVLARLQGAGAHVRYIDHLQLVHPARIERALSAAGLRFENLVERKLDDAMRRGPEAVVHYGRAAGAAALARRVGAGSLMRFAVLRTGLYPSLMYLARKP